MSALNRIFGWIVILVFATVRVATSAQEQPAESFTGTPEENKLIALIDSFQASYGPLAEKANQITDLTARSKYFDDHDPAKEFVPKLLDYESRHAGEDLSLMALRKIGLAAEFRASDNPLEQLRKTALQRLLNYADRPVLPEILRYLDSGDYDPATDNLLRSLAANPRTDAAVREFSKLMMAECMIAAINYRDVVLRRLRELENGAAERHAGEQEWLRGQSALLPEAAQIRAWEQESTVLLQSIANAGHDYRQPAVKAADPKWRLLQFDPERTKTMPRLADMAEGLLFKHSHLKLGKPAPDLRVRLVSGSDWSLAEQQGKVVVIQFSFKGCGPCEAMYPELRELQTAHGDRIAILSVLADENKSDTDEAVAAGKLTWNVDWDGFRGKVATRWAVRSFPTVYVIDREGRIADTIGRDLTKKIADLLK